MPCEYVGGLRGLIKGKCVNTKAKDAGNADAKKIYETICTTEEYVNCTIRNLRKEGWLAGAKP